MCQCVICLFRPPELSGRVSSQQCPADWKEINSRCYFLSTERKTWEDSRKDCQSKNADLVVINSEQEQVQNSKSVVGVVCMCVWHYWLTFEVIVTFSIISINRGPCTVLMGMLISYSGLVCMTQLGPSNGWMDLHWLTRKAFRITLNFSVRQVDSNKTLVSQKLMLCRWYWALEIFTGPKFWTGSETDQWQTNLNPMRLDLRIIRPNSKCD